ncbi:hypothetical protein [Thalassospira sp.]|uniref:hypothetical protein n=1 Tax=Thalassospira sp. TaxID=1912094 RepID=UPI0027356477|nr:hypothetical protein [Thalassospira sp.]MDP2698193.1 hypothetical protein [Thalassospira sp.]
MMTREWEIRAQCRVWRGRYVIRGDVGRIAANIAQLHHTRFPGIKPCDAPLRVAAMAVLAILAEECSEDGVTAAELSFLLTTSLERPVAPGRIAAELDALGGLVWRGDWAGEPLYVLEKRGLQFCCPSHLAGTAANEQDDGIGIDPAILADVAPQTRYRVV